MKEIRVFADERTRGEMMLSKGKPAVFKNGHASQVFRNGGHRQISQPPHVGALLLSNGSLQ